MRFSSFIRGNFSFPVAADGPPDKTLLLCLHGFPESWFAWEAVMQRLAGRFHVVAPVQRGYGPGCSPSGVEAYRVRELAADIAALADHLSPDRPWILAGHDWGASVAYALAMRHPERISHLVIANGVHPWCFQNAIAHDPGQRAASQYINRLRAADAEALLSANGHAKLMRMIEGFSATPWMTDALRQRYRESWSQPGVLTGMLNWYRATPLVVPATGEPAGDIPLLGADKASFRITMPHLVLWGEADQALRPSCLDGLEDFAPDLTIRKISGASHWILHERPEQVAQAMLDFLG